MHSNLILMINMKNLRIIMYITLILYLNVFFYCFNLMFLTFLHGFRCKKIIHAFIVGLVVKVQRYCRQFPRSLSTTSQISALRFYPREPVKTAVENAVAT